MNYRGSTGFGQHSILSLIGQIGSQDVKDVQVCPFCFFCSQIQERVSATNPASDAVCQNYKNIIIFPIFDHICTCSSITYTVTPADVRKWSVLASLSFTQRAVLTALERDPNLDPDRLAAIGGSHGGFLACHLLGQYPESYRVCAARNPVINAATLLGTSDIVDWWGRYASTDQSFCSAESDQIHFIRECFLSPHLQALHQCWVSLLVRPDTHCWGPGCYVTEVTHRTCHQGQTQTQKSHVITLMKRPEAIATKLL